jgi:sec-independent protein translocase protein TatB
VFNLGAGEITVILVLALIFLGPKKLPDLATGLGKLIREIRKATSDVKNEITLDDSFRKPFEELRDAVTLHPDELKRRDQIRKSVEEAKKRAEEAEAAMAAAAAAVALPESAVGEPAPIPAGEAPAQLSSEAPVQVAAQLPSVVPSVAPSVIPSVLPPSGTVARSRPAPSKLKGSAAARNDAPEGKDSAPVSPAPPDAPAATPVPPPAPPSSEILTSAVMPLGGAPRVTPPISSLDNERANTTQTLSEADLLASVPASKRRPTPPPLPGLDRQPPPANRMGLPRVTPPVSSLSGDRANATQSLSESDLLPPGAGKPPPLPGPKKT